MALTDPRFILRDELFASRPNGNANVKFAGLWCAGSYAALARATVAVVGTRVPSAGGAARARALGAALSRAGICVVSGLALGVDGHAHAGALEGGTPTIGVLGGGHRHFFPKRHRDLAERIIAAGGAILSPFAPDEPARPPQFLQRNGVVAALADAVVVVEAARRSGALNTASWAANIGLDVLAYPGDVDRVVAAGCNALIRDGATLVRDADDVLEALGFAAPAISNDSRPPRDREAFPGFEPAPLQRAILNTLALQPRSYDDLVAITGAPTGDVLASVVGLEIFGAVERRDPNTIGLAKPR